MARRRESLVDVLLVSSWWASVFVAAIVYGLLAFAVPAYVATSQLTSAFAQIARMCAPFAAAFFLLIGLLSLIRSNLIKRKFNGLGSIEEIRRLSWRKFESIVGEAFRRRGYEVRENVVDGPDGGVDLVLRKDGAKFYVQCKQWKQAKVGVKPIRELYGVIMAGEADGGFVVASGEYTREAYDFAHNCGIELIDGAALQEMIAKIREPEPFMDPTSRRRVDVAVEPRASDPTCPLCGGVMVRRTAKRGVNVGLDFWGCRSYPRCRGTTRAG